MDEKLDMVSKQEFCGRKELCDERFRRDNTRLKDTEEALDRVSTTLTQIAEIIKQSTQGQADHEARLRVIEARGGQWLDKLIAVALGAVVTAFVAYILTGGKLT